MAEKRGSPRKHKAKDSERQILKKDSRTHTQPARTRRRSHATRTAASRSGCYNPEVRKGCGAVIFILGFPTAIAGVVMTVVDASDNEKGSKYPAAFAVIGPVLIAIAIVFLVVGFILSSPSVSKAIWNCFDLDNPRGCCRVHCPRLSHCLKPDDIIQMNQHAMDALKSEPGKSALRRVPNGDGPRPGMLSRDQSVDSGDLQEAPMSGGDHVDFVSELRVHSKPKGVRFSESDVDGIDVRKTRAGSTTSMSDNGSVLSLRNCKVHPKADIWWTDTDDGSNKVVVHGGTIVNSQPITELL